jgi:hypothetical protein
MFLNLDSTLISLKGMCLRRFEKACLAGESVLSFDSGRPQVNSEWYLLYNFSNFFLSSPV